MRSKLLLFAAFCAASLCGCGGSGNSGVQGGVGSRYALRSIPPLPGDNAVVVKGINNAGQIVGYSYVASILNGAPTTAATGGPLHPFLITNGVQSALPTLNNDPSLSTIPEAINDAGVIVGFSYPQAPPKTPAVYTPVVWRNSSIQLMPVANLPTDSKPEFLSINSAGIILAEHRFQLFMVSSNSATLLTTTQGATATASALNEAGDVAATLGDSRINTPGVWHNGAFTALSVLPAGPNNSQGSAAALNNAGDAAGWSESQVSANQWEAHAVVWQNGQVTDLNGLLNALWSMSDSINSRGVVAGHFVPTAGSGTNAFVYDHGTVTDLTPLLNQRQAFNPQIVKINDSGQVLINSYSGAYLAVPIGQ